MRITPGDLTDPRVTDLFKLVLDSTDIVRQRRASPFNNGRSVRAFALQLRAFGAPLRGCGA
jgi:hypothetical protein